MTQPVHINLDLSEIKAMFDFYQSALTITAKKLVDASPDMANDAADEISSMRSSIAHAGGTQIDQIITTLKGGSGEA